MNLNDKLNPIDGPETARVEYRSPTDEDSTRAHMHNWIEAIRTGGKPVEDVRVGHHAALVGHMCNLSHKAGKPCTVEQDDEEGGSLSATPGLTTRAPSGSGGRGFSPGVNDVVQRVALHG